MKALCRTHPEIAVAALKILAGRLRKCAELVEALSLREVDQRLARGRVVVRCGARHGEIVGVGITSVDVTEQRRATEIQAHLYRKAQEAIRVRDDFLSIAADSRGNYVINGLVDDPDASRNGVLVVNGQRLIAREGEPVDADGNGRFDDQAEIGAFGIEDAIITADGRVLAQVSTRAPGYHLNGTVTRSASCPCSRSSSTRRSAMISAPPRSNGTCGLTTAMRIATPCGSLRRKPLQIPHFRLPHRASGHSIGGVCRVSSRRDDGGPPRDRARSPCASRAGGRP